MFSERCAITVHTNALVCLKQCDVSHTAFIDRCVIAWLIHALMCIKQCAVLTAFIGILLVITNQTTNKKLNIQHAFLMTSLAWIIISLHESRIVGAMLQ